MRFARESHVCREIAHHVRHFVTLRFPEIAETCRKTLEEWNADNAPRLGAALAFYMIFSLVPLVIVILGMGALLFGKEAAQGELFRQIRGLVGSEQALTIQDLVLNAYKPGAGSAATGFGLLVAAIGASRVAAELRDAMNTVWHTPAAATSFGLGGGFFILKERLQALFIVIAGGAFLILSLLINACVTALGTYFHMRLPIPPALLGLTDLFASLLVATVLFASIYRILPEVRLRWSDVGIGAGVTSLLFTLGKQLIALYLGRASIGSAYGAAASFVVLSVWVYYSAQVFMLGAEFTKVYARTFGSHAPPLSQAS